MTALTSEARAAALPDLLANGWQTTEGRDAIRKVWRFADFASAWGFISQVALLAERMDHHPEWTNRYNIVDVTLTTHDCGGLSDLDIAMARQIDRLAGNTPVANAGAPTTCEERAARR